MNNRQLTGLGIILIIIFCIGYCMGLSYNDIEATVGIVLVIISLSLTVVIGIINACIEFAKKKRQNKKED